MNDFLICITNRSPFNQISVILFTSKAIALKKTVMAMSSTGRFINQGHYFSSPLHSDIAKDRVPYTYLKFQV